MKWTFENGPTVPVVKEYLVGVVDARTFVVLSQFLNRNVQEVRLLVAQFQTVTQRLPTGSRVNRCTSQIGIIDPSISRNSTGTRCSRCSRGCNVRLHNIFPYR